MARKAIETRGSMIIDDILDHGNPDFNGYGKLSDAVVFRVADSFYDYFARSRDSNDVKKDKIVLKIGSLLPYDNIVIVFNDYVFWSVLVGVTGQGEYIVSCYFGKHDQVLKLTAHGFEIPFCFVFVFDLKTMECIDVRDGLHPELPKLDEYGLEGRRYNRAVAGFTLSRFLDFLSCKNIRSVKNDLPEKVQKKRKKQGKKPLISYYTLELKQAKSYESEGNKNLWSNRIHLCRGHFREYTEDAPLFGRITGRFWIPPHARGSKREGVIYKDYSIKEEEAA